MPMIDLPMMSGEQVVIERRVGEGGNRGLSPGVPILVAAAADAVGKPPVDYLIRACTETEHVENPNNALRSVDPAGEVRNYMERLQKKPLDIAEFKPTLLQGPRHGSLEYEVSNAGRMFYLYDPKPGFLGKDNAVFMVEYQGKHFKVSIDIQVLEMVSVHQSACPSQPKVIKLRKSSHGNGSDLSPGDQNLIGIADLAGSAVGQAFGTEADARITLDSTVAGDVLGIDHRQNAHDDTATTRQPGVRRTLTGDQQLDLMALAGYFPVPDRPSQP